MPGPIRTANGGNATAAVTAATHAPLIPGAMRIAVRDAGCRLARLQNGRIPQSDHIIMPGTAAVLGPVPKPWMMGA